VDPDSKPPTNVHVIIGRNGIGKTTLLNNMVCSVLMEQPSSECGGKFYTKDLFKFTDVALPKDYFSSLVSVSFSAFDPFVPPSDQPDRSKGLAYFYIGMKKRQDITMEPRCVAKSKEDFVNDILDSIKACFSQPLKKSRWFSAIARLESDPNFKDFGLSKLSTVVEADALHNASILVEEMSSGHSIVLLTLSKLVETVEEKTLVLMDEPESHLHPPLLAALTRALSDLLHDRNAVAIIATHSPVIVQEVPSSCVWKITRSGSQARSDRPEGETFGENVGVLTREIFGLEVAKSGFHSMLQLSVDKGGSFDEIMTEYREQLGFEAQAILRAMIRNRDHSNPVKNETN
jgi:predicted ATPase